MTDQSITSLIEKLEGAEVGSRELDAELWLMFTPGATRKQSVVKSSKDLWPDYTIDETRENGVLIIVPHFTTSLDAALALADRVLDQRGPININICLAGSAQVVISNVGPCDPVMAQVVARTPALALCAAILRAQSEARV